VYTKHRLTLPAQTAIVERPGSLSLSLSLSLSVYLYIYILHERGSRTLLRLSPSLLVAFLLDSLSFSAFAHLSTERLSLDACTASGSMILRGASSGMLLAGCPHEKGGSHF
jgi:hypothetical protein